VREPHCHGLRKVLQPINDAAIRVLDEPGNVIEMHERAGDSNARAHKLLRRVATRPGSRTEPNRASLPCRADRFRSLSAHSRARAVHVTNENSSSVGIHQRGRLLEQAE
jgi:hypothetical protein